MTGCYFRQSRLCPHCGKSHWRIFGFCNVCWCKDDYKEELGVQHLKVQRGKQLVKTLTPQ